MRLLSVVLTTLLLSSPLKASANDPLDPLYARMATDLQNGKPIVITTHVALCDNRIIACGGRAYGDGDQPGRNLYWGGAAGFEATFRLARGFRNVHRDAGDGKIVLARSVYRRHVKPNAAWRRHGITRPFELYVVGLAYRGTKIAQAMERFVAEVHGRRGAALQLQKGPQIHIGGLGHVVGYAGHNHLMDIVGDDRWPKWTRKESIGYFALACKTAPYLAKPLNRPQAHGLLLTRVFMYPGAFTALGLARGLAEGLSHRGVFNRGADAYARAQKRPPKLIRSVFTYDSRPRYRRRYLGANR